VVAVLAPKTLVGKTLVIEGGEEIAPHPEFAVYASTDPVVVLYRIIPFAAVPGLCAVVPLGTVRTPVPVIVKSFPTETFPVV
tara:strand:+ start:376 stop:621 length:246 start_codon:yes stop_codon:yes gene_type:complete